MAVITGRPGSDTLTGTDGTDLIFGLDGADRLSGGADNDVFVFGRMLEPFTTVEELRSDTGVGPGNRDIVLDFQQGKDLLDLSAYENILARPGVPRSS
jgi:Ca2+-binding RTX toxin-like protein